MWLCRPCRCAARSRRHARDTRRTSAASVLRTDGRHEMTIRIGANPIGWTNDDLQEIGGDTPLETCLAEARQAGIEGMELGHKFPREPEALESALAPFGLACVGGVALDRAPEPLGRGGVRARQAASRPVARHGHRRVHRRRDVELHPRAARHAAVAPPEAGRGRLGRIRSEDHGAGRAARRRGSAGSATTTTWARSSRARPTSTPSWRTRGRPRSCCSTRATPPGAAPTRPRSPRATATGSATSM